MEIAAAQGDARRAFVGGGPGVIVSGLVWLCAAFVFDRAGVAPAFATLFFGGMLIYPLSTLAVRSIFRREPAARGNALVPIALESTIAMIGCLGAAWLLLPFAPESVLEVAAIAVGTHYFAFATLYGNKIFWLLGAAVTAVGVTGIWGPLEVPGGTVMSVAVIELAVGLLLTIASARAQ